MSDSQTGQYNELFNTALQWMWGDGFLSPGGADEVDHMLRSVDIEGRAALEVGCGLGAGAVMLVEKYGAGSLLGLDVEAHLIEHCRERAEKAGIAGKTEFRLVEPGPLPLEDDQFDVVFSKDAIVHIPDSAALFEDVYRVLKPGGWAVMSDWYRGEEPLTDEMAAYLDRLDVGMQMKPIEADRAELLPAGLTCLAATMVRLEARRATTSALGLRHAVVNELLMRS